MSTPARPDLKFDTLDALVADADRLRAGYEKAGQWDLGMVLDHLNRTMSGPFGPGRNWVPWPATAAVRAAIHGMVRRGRYPSMKIPAMPSLRPTPGADADAALASLRDVVRRTEGLSGDTVQLPPFGPISRADFVGMQLLHGAHHMSFLRPTAST